MEFSPTTHKGFKSTTGMIMGVVVVVLVALIAEAWIEKHPRPMPVDEGGRVVVSSASPTPTATAPEWISNDISWQDFKKKYGFQITIPSNWTVNCVEGTNTDCKFQTSQDIADEKQWDGEGETGPFAQMFIEVYPSKEDRMGHGGTAIENELSHVKLGSNVFDHYEVFGFGEVYGIAHGDKFFQFDMVGDSELSILSSFKFTN